MRNILHISHQLSNWRRTCQLVAHRPLHFYFFFVFLHSIMCGRLSLLSVQVKLSYCIVKDLTKPYGSVSFSCVTEYSTSVNLRFSSSISHCFFPSSDILVAAVVVKWQMKFCCVFVFDATATEPHHNQNHQSSVIFKCKTLKFGVLFVSWGIQKNKK